MTQTEPCPYCAFPNPSISSLCKSCGAKLEVVIAEDLPKNTRLSNGQFKILRLIGRGGFGITYLASEDNRKRKIAIKELFPSHLVSRASNNVVIAKVGSELEFRDTCERFEREATIASSLKHPSATRILKSWTENGTTYTAMEYIQGQTLEQRIQTGKLLSEIEVITCMKPILEVLEELHSKGLLHRDIKPANIIFGANRVELIDYGSATGFQKGERLKVTSRLLTPEYAPLEQFASETELSPATDLYALGATMYEAMTGRPPPSALERANGAKLEEIQGFPGSIGWLLLDLIEKMLEMKVANRPKNAREVLDLLETLERNVNKESDLVKTNPFPLVPQPTIPVAPQSTNLVTLWWGTLFTIATLWALISLSVPISPQSNTMPVPTKVADVRVYLIPTWLENQSEPIMTVLLNFVDTDGKATSKPNRTFKTTLVSGKRNKNNIEFNFSGITDANPWYFSTRKIQIKADQYVSVISMGNENSRGRLLVRKDFRIKSNFVKLEPSAIFRAYRPGSLAEPTMLKWFSAREAQAFIVTSPDKTFTPKLLTQSRFEVESSKLNRTFTITAMNVKDGFLEKTIDASRVAFSQVTICLPAWDEQNDFELITILTGACT